MDIVYQKSAEFLVFLWVMAMSRMENFFLNVIKVHIYAYAHINIKYFDFLNDIWPLETGKVIKIQEN